jgi:formylglycine-generating enzyme required for sulfatase activity
MNFELIIKSMKNTVKSALIFFFLLFAQICPAQEDGCYTIGFNAGTKEYARGETHLSGSRYGQAIASFKEAKDHFASTKENCRNPNVAALNEWIRKCDNAIQRTNGIVRENADADRRAREKAEADRRAREREEADRIARERAEAERRARERAEANRIAKEKAEADRQARERAEAESKRIGIKMVYVQGGTFTMGCTSEQSSCRGREKPAHQVTLSSFYIGKYEVTQAQWKAVMGSNPSYFEEYDRPVENVSWDDVQDFIRKLNAQTGKRYRLPTEAEWEYAARGGNQSKGYKYSGSNTLGNVAWYDGNSGSVTHSVGQKSPNELGIYDMSGNVREWCSDWFGNYLASAQSNPTGASSGFSRVVRGGSWGNYAGDWRVAYRDDFVPGFRHHILGFRLACNSN